MTHVGKKIAFRLSRIFSLTARNLEFARRNQQLRFGFTAFDEEPDLAADRIEEFENVRVRFADLRAEKLDDALAIRK